MEFQAVNLLYDRLVTLGPKGQLRPSLATSWTATPTKAVFHIRAGATCDDGTPLTAKIVAASLNYLADPKTNSPTESETFGDGTAHASANDAAGTVTVTVSKPWNSLVPGMALPNAGIICPAGLANPSLMTHEGEGSGPYVMTASLRGSQYTFTARKDYDWGPDGWSTRDNGVPQTIILQSTENNTTAANDFVTGADQVTSWMSGVQVPRIESSVPTALRFLAPALGATGLMFNPAPGLPEANPVVRRAIMLAVNRKDFVDAWTNGQGRTSETMLTPGMQCYNSAIGKNAQPYDTALAKRLLASQGWKPGANGKLMKNGKPLTIRISAWNQQGAAGEYLLTALDAIGITASVKVVDTTTWENTLYSTHQFDVSAYDYSSSNPNPSVIVTQDQSIGTKAPAYYAAAAAANAVSAGQSCALWDKAMLLELPYVNPIGYNVYSFFTNGYELSAVWDYIDPFTFYKVSKS